MSNNASQHAPDETLPSTDRRAMGARPSESLIALTHDGPLRETLTAVAPEHVLSFATNEADLADHLRAEPAGVAFLDSAALQVPVAELTERLRAQFPDLVLIVAGGSGDQAALSQQVMSGIVYRFLHKPVSAQRVKLFVDSAWRHRDAEHAATGTAAAVKRESSVRRYLTRHASWLGLAALALTVAGGLALRQASRTPSVPPRVASLRRVTPPVDSLRAREIASLLARADAALARGALISPSGENAADLYRQVLKRDAANAGAREGLRRVVDRLLTSADQALLDNHIDQSRELTDAARAIDPGNTRAALQEQMIGLHAQIAQHASAAAHGTMGGDTGATRGEEAGATKGPGAAQAHAHARAPARAPPRTASATLADNPDRMDVSHRVIDFLKQADSRMRAGALIGPDQNNAKFYIDAAGALAPNSPSVHMAQRALAERLIAEAQSAVRGGDFSAAERWTQAASDAGAESDEIAAVRRSLQDARGSATANTVLRLAGLFNQRLEQGRLLTPANDSARFYLSQLESADPKSPSTVLARTALAGRLLDQARTALAGKDLQAAQAWLAEAQVVGANAGDARAVEEAIASSRNAGRSSAILPDATTLKKLHDVEPDYPLAALRLGRSGTVFMRFTVEADGSVGDIEVTNADPPQMFDDAAIAAVRQWRYQPIIRDGHPVAERVALRLVFRPSPF